jgi:ribosome-associated protein
VIVVISQSDTKKTVLQSTNAALDKKAKNLIILKVKELSSFTDYFIICSGTSDRQVKGIAASIEETLKKSGIQPLGIEGENTGNWILMDYGDVIIHIFYEPTREFYDIERLWSDVPSMSINEDVDKLTSLDDGM